MFGDILGFVGGMLGANKSANTSKDINNENIAQSREFAQSGIQWRVADAKAAGIHPLAAMGLPLSGPPILSGNNTDFASSYRDMGQSLGRAADSVRTREERAMAESSAALSLERQGLENELLRSQITSVQRASNPPFPNPTSGSSGAIPGQPVGDVDRVNQEVTNPASSNPSQFAGAHASIAFQRLDNGGLAPIMTDAKGAPRDDQDITDLSTLEWWARNRLIPSSFIGGVKPPSSKDHPLPKGYTRWVWNPLKQAFFPAKGNPSRWERIRGSLTRPLW